MRHNSSSITTSRARGITRGPGTIGARCARRTRALGAAARHVAVDLTPQAVEQIAIRVAQLLRHEQSRAQPDTPAVLMTVKELARHLKLNPAWVYEHAEELGAIRTGDGPKARIRFDPHTATEALKRRQKPAVPAANGSPGRAPTRPGPAAYPVDAPLLKVRNPYARGGRRRLSAMPGARGVR